MIQQQYLHSEITEAIIQAYFKVYNKLGFGFLERVYINALIIELSAMGFTIAKNHPHDVYYYEHLVGRYYSDVIVNNCVIIEVKAGESLCKQHEAQLLNYLKASDIEVGLLLNFGKKPEFKRKLFTDDYKHH